MTTYSQSDLVTRILRDLGVISAEETPSDLDYAHTVETIESEIPAMAALGIPIWNGSEVSIPQQYLTALSRRLGLAVGMAFGLWTLAEVEQAIPLAEKRLRAMAAIRPTGAPTEMEYF